MKLKLISKTLISLSLTGSLLAFSSYANAAGFQLYEQDSAGLGDYHAGGAAEADSASTAWYNPAGLIRLKRQEITTGVAAVHTNLPYNGTVEVNTVNPGNPATVHAQGGNWGYIPNFYYARPINDNWAVGFGAVVPFGLETDYSSDSYIRYAATKTSVEVIDIGPSVAYQLNRVISLGLGLDAQHMEGIFNQYAGVGTTLDTKSKNSGSDWAYGYHAGILLQFTPTTRVGLAYHSQVVHHLTGKSKFIGPLANGLAGGTQVSDDLKGNVALPRYAQLSFYHDFNAQWSILASAMYTMWSVFRDLRLENVAAINAVTFSPDNNAVITVAEDYRNTWNFALGAHYKPIQNLTIKAGVGYDESPARSAYRNVQLPDQNRFAVAAGLHYQFLPDLGADIGYMHLFIRKANINLTQAVSNEEVTTIGSTQGSANLYGLQVTWDF